MDDEAAMSTGPLLSIAIDVAQGIDKLAGTVAAAVLDKTPITAYCWFLAAAAVSTSSP
jgi:hypothetical protein